MKRTAEEEASRLSDVLCFGSSGDVTAAIEALADEELYEACTSIMANGHTIVHVLTQRQKVPSLQAVLKRGVDVNTRNAQGTTPIHLALQHNALSSAKILIDHGARVSEIISRRKGTSLLHMLVMCDRPLAVRLLLAEGAEVDCRDGQDRTPLHLAAIYGNLRITDILMQNADCNVNSLDGTGHTPLMLAILNNNADLARHLSASTRTDVSLKDRNGMSALHLAVALGQVEVARAILQRNTANINSKERCMGRTPLHFACALTANNREDVIMSGDFTSCNHASPSDGADSDYDIPDVSNKETASDRQNGNSTNGLVNDSNESETTDDNGNASSSNGTDAHDEAPLSTMADHETKPDDHPTETKGHKPLEPTRSKTPRNGLRHGRESDRSSHKNLTTATGGKTTGNTKPGNKLRLLASLTTPYHERPRPSADKYKARPATASARLSTRRVSSGQQRRGFSPRLSVASLHHGLSTLNSHNRRDSTVSFVLTPSNVGTVRCKMVSLLLDHGADANLMTQFRKSALHMAAMLGDANVMALLLPETTNPNMLSASNKTALHLAVEGGHTPNVSQLIHAGANLGLRDMEGMTPLHMAAKLGHADMVTMLLRAKADKNSSDFKQMTPLHHACKNGHTDVTDILLRAGCRTDLVDDQGVLALDYRDNCIAEKDEKEEVGGSDVTPSVLPEETKMEPRRQRKKGAVFLPPAMLPTHAELE